MTMRNITYVVLAFCFGWIPAGRCDQSRLAAHPGGETRSAREWTFMQHSDEVRSIAAAIRS
jgi:hypothetical protein